MSNQLIRFIDSALMVHTHKIFKWLLQLILMALSAEEKRRFLKSLDEDKEFRYAVAGYLGIGEILKRLDSLEESMKKLWENQNKLWEEVKSLREDFNTLKSDMGTLKSDVSTLKEDVSTLTTSSVSFQFSL